MRINIEIDDKLIEEAFSLSSARTKKELVRLALQDLVKAKNKTKNKKDLFDLSGKIQFFEGYSI